MPLAPVADSLQLSNFWSGCDRLIVAFSGGCDSSALLHWLCEYRRQEQLDCALSAIHINHGLHPQADAWQQHCEDFCAVRDVPLTLCTVAVPPQGASLEDRARKERYRAFEGHLQRGDLLVLAHHADDQAETILMRMLRGSGPGGVAGIPSRRRLGSGELVRPLLSVSRQALEDYACACSLRWVEDDSNADEQHDRNFIRHRVMPLLRQRWPGASTSLLRSATLAAETDYLGQQLGERCLRQVCDQRGVPRTEQIFRLSEFERNLLLRRWCEQCGLTPPPASRLGQLAELCTAAADRAPQLRWRQPDDSEVMVRRYRGGLYLIRPLSAPPDSLPWDPMRQPVLQLQHGLLRAEVGPGGMDLRAIDGLEVRFRGGGEHCRPVGRAGGRTLSRYLQERGVPPWERVGLPLLYSENRLAVIGDLAVCEGFAAPAGSEGLQVSWQSGSALSTAVTL